MTTARDPLTLMAMWGSMQDFNPSQGFSFEGPEKRLEVIIRFLPETHKKGLHSLNDNVWEYVVSSLHAKIVSSESNDYIKSYVLTESSLFVMKNRIILITCGTTTLLNSIPSILEAISSIRAELEWVSFMHKNYSFPWEQKGPHTSLADEFATLKKFFPSGKPYIFGPVDRDHYFLFCYDDIIRPCCSSEDDTQLSMTMYGLDPNQTKYWFSDHFSCTNSETAAIRSATGLDKLLQPKIVSTYSKADNDDCNVQPWTIHDLQFEPCGYSINAICGEEYQTMHITPEAHCSFASYETNSRAANYADRLGNVLSVFRPQRFTVIIFLDPESAVGRAYHADQGIGVEPKYFTDYQLLHRTINEFAPGYVAMKINYVLKGCVENLAESDNTSSNIIVANKTVALTHDECSNDAHITNATNATCEVDININNDFFIDDVSQKE